ncbi:GNAT family N-acetyltransferase [Jidongwangia harbinensis]|uniref:GNAT family N-acetyltransferase n=1 Tax=Jidongwangia harbinensis TaxID=2878561 RepID=UPI001CD9BCEF|nr:GNAT family N-acetyltransferase [Jidongwangia harbinensis]MCA2217706.1 GNAT family N-acetyltransferase [Jidongwangia harbinensis]
MREVHDGPLLDTWCALLAEGMAAESGAGPDGPALAARVRAEPPGGEVRRWAVTVDGEVAGVARSAPDADARFVRLYVSPRHRGRGLGTALFAAVRAAHPHTALKGITVAGGPGERFAARLGATVLLRLVVLAQDLAGLPVPGEPPPGTVFWTGGAPDDLVDSYAAAYRSLADAPGAGHQLADLHYDRDRIRRWEREVRTGGHDLWVCAVVEDRTVVAFTEVEVGPEPAASQHSTVVLPGHRRRGLGTAVKLALAARLRAARPDLTTVTTTVSAANTPMLALNERAGYRVVRTRLLWHLVV